jgi:hypothetical protein
VSSSTSRTPLAVFAGAVAILAVAASPIGDQGWGFPLVILAGPVITGAVAVRRGRSWKPVAAAWALSGLLMLVTDWAVNDEDQLFHLILAGLMAALTALGAALGRVARRRPRTAVTS